TKQCRMGGKVILLGVHHDRSSTVHLVENLYPEEYPRPVFFQKPHRFRYMDAGKLGEVETFLHAVHWEDPDINSFGDYIGAHYGIYRSDMAGRVPVLVYRAADQLEAFRKEMLNDVSMFDSRFWDRRR
ncbi:MAG: AAC(3) family N-acetyltransferase, partial [Proteobacteria bacterium]|nr:AAC(3) family N-acetyltransferase [Pseudomonadota bacterium]